MSVYSTYVTTNTIKQEILMGENIDEFSYLVRLFGGEILCELPTCILNIL